MMNILAILALLIPLAAPLPSSKCQCRKVKDESPKLGTVFVTMNGGRVRKLQGTVFSPGGSVMKDAIVEVYDNRSNADDENISYDALKESTSRKRKAACMTGGDGGFFFTNLPPGRYLLIVGHRNDSQFSAMRVVVTLDPRRKNSSNEDLKIELVLSI
jgi:hypothetical protein